MPVFTEMRPYNEELSEIPSYRKSRKNFRKWREAAKLFQDLRPADRKDQARQDEELPKVGNIF